MYAREGIELDRALMADWMGKVVFLLTPLADVLGRIADHPINKIDALLPWFWTK